MTSRGIATAWLNTFMILGGVVGTFISGRLLGPIGWRGLLVAYSVPGVLWALWFAWWFRSRPADHPGVNEAERRLIDGAAPDAVGCPPVPAPEVVVSDQIEPSPRRIRESPA